MDEVKVPTAPQRPKPEQYRHIKAWGRMMGSNPGWIEMEQARAAAMEAPLTAIYQAHSWDNTGKWHTYDDITSDDTRRTIDEILASFGT